MDKEKFLKELDNSEIEKISGGVLKSKSIEENTWDCTAICSKCGKTESFTVMSDNNQNPYKVGSKYLCGHCKFKKNNF